MSGMWIEERFEGKKERRDTVVHMYSVAFFVFVQCSYTNAAPTPFSFWLHLAFTAKKNAIAGQFTDNVSPRIDDISTYNICKSVRGDKTSALRF